MNRHVTPAAFLFVTACTDFKFEWKLSLGEVLDTSVTLIIAVLAVRLAGQLTDRRKYFIEIVSKDLAFIAERLAEIERVFEAATSVPQPIAECHQVVSAFRRANNRAELLRTQLGRLNFNAHALASCDELRVLLTSFKQQSTSLGFPIDGYTLGLPQHAAYEKATLTIRHELSQLARHLIT